MTEDDWNIIEEDCRCKYQRLNDCRNSYTDKCGECGRNTLIKEGLKDYYDRPRKDWKIRERT